MTRHTASSNRACKTCGHFLGMSACFCVF